MTRVATISRPLALGLLLTLLTGCSSTWHSRAAIRPSAGDGAGGWNVALATPDVVQQLRPLPPEARAEFYRNDRQLGVWTPSVPTASDQWTPPARPTLRRARRIHLDTRADSLLFFSTERGWYRTDRDVRR